MKLTDLFIRRPVLAIVVNFVILLAGYQAIRSLNVRQYPRSDLSVVSVQTVYVGANADLVRGFLTTPLERVIASAEGIDYMESTSAQGLSTINVHLKLNYDTNAALTQIQAKVAQVRNDLPPEAEAPIINVQTTDDQIASMYLSFYSDDLEANQITDYLTRVVQPKIASVNGVQRADILGARTFAMRIWLKPDKMASLNVSPTDVRNALAGNNYLSALGATKGSMITVNLVANTDLQQRPGIREPRRPPERQHHHPPARTWPTSCSARRTTRATCASTARRRRSWASSCCRRPTRSMSSTRCASSCPRSSARCPPGCTSACPTTRPSTSRTPSARSSTR